MNNFDELLAAIRACSPEQKQKIFSEIRGSILIHDLERSFNVRAEVILEAISRSNDLTQRGVRGLIAETAFVLDIIPIIKDWKSDPPIGDLPYDARLKKDDRTVRIQVKMQRKKAGVPWLRNGAHVVEVQRTRTGTGKDGAATRPYRFGEFDLLAVCMQASTGDWHSFMYVPSSALTAKPSSKDEIETFQKIPEFGDNGIWTNELTVALDRVS
jgi:hypothetical protein